MADQSQISEEQRKQLEEKLKNMSPDEIAAFQKQQCIFCKIIDNSVPSTTIYEDNQCIAVLDINPSAKGHLLLIPKHHYAIMPQVPDDDLGHFFIVAKTLSHALLKGLKVSGTNIFIANGHIAGQRAQHFLIHVIPRKEGDKLLPVKEKIIDHEMQEKVKLAIESSLNKLLGIKGDPKKDGKAPAKKKIPVTKKNEEIIPKDDDFDAEELFGSKNKQKDKDNSEEQDHEPENDSDDSDEINDNSTEKSTRKGGVDLDEIANLFR